MLPEKAHALKPVVLRTTHLLSDISTLFIYCCIKVNARNCATNVINNQLQTALDAVSRCLTFVIHP